MYQPFVYQPHHDDHKGWAAGAGHYAKLLVPNTVCFLTKEMDHRADCRLRAFRSPAALAGSALRRQRLSLLSGVLLDDHGM